VLIRAIIRETVTFTLGGMCFFALQLLRIDSAAAKTLPQSASQSLNTNPVTQNGAEQHPLHQVQPISPQRISPNVGVQRTWPLKPNPGTKNEIIERRSEQIKREDFSRSLERRRYQLSKQRRVSRVSGLP
jgi:hypothetical protein